ncbi:MAG: iron-containing alcohol dehydrogenase family protein [Christensenellales bacterium]
MKLTYHMSTKVIMGEKCIRDNAELIRGMGKRALIVTGASSAKLCGALDDVTASLKSAGKSHVIYDKVMNNPTVDCVYDGAAIARREGTDFVIAIGGGSPMDAAKAIALLARQIMPRKKLFSGEFGTDVLPMAHVPTTAGTGSEVTPYAILTNDEIHSKQSISSPALFPKYAFLDVRYLNSLPHQAAVNTAIDALSHAVEGMLTVRAGIMSDLIARESISRISACFDALTGRSLDKENKEQLLYGSMLAGIVIANTGTTALHSMGYPLTYYKNIEHGRANGLLMAAYLEFLNTHVPEKISEILSLMNIDSVNSLRLLLDKLLGGKEAVTLKEIEQYAENSSMSKNVKNTIYEPSVTDMQGIYRQSFKL